jgi:hypothetical protein
MTLHITTVCGRRSQEIWILQVDWDILRANDGCSKCTTYRFWGYILEWIPQREVGIITCVGNSRASGGSWWGYWRSWHSNCRWDKGQSRENSTPRVHLLEYAENERRNLKKYTEERAIETVAFIWLGESRFRHRLTYGLERRKGRRQKSLITNMAGCDNSGSIILKHRDIHKTVLTPSKEHRRLTTWFENFAWTTIGVQVVIQIVWEISKIRFGHIEHRTPTLLLPTLSSLEHLWLWNPMHASDGL